MHILSNKIPGGRGGDKERKKKKKKKEDVCGFFILWFSNNVPDSNFIAIY